MKRLALVGRGLTHSASPRLWQNIFRESGHPGDCGLRDVGEDGLAGVVAELRSGALDQLHVTMPYKQWAFEVAETRTAEASWTGVVNGLMMRAGRLAGVNTDVLAARSLLADLPTRPRKILVLGAGATGASLLEAATEVADTSYLANRDPRRSAALAARDWAASVAAVPWDDRAEYAAEVDLVVNTTPCGLTDQRSPLRHWPVGPTHLYDLIYQPDLTPLQDQAARAGATIVDGLAHLQAHAEAATDSLGIPAIARNVLRRILTDIAGRAPLRWETPELHASDNTR